MALCTELVFQGGHRERWYVGDAAQSLDGSYSIRMWRGHEYVTVHVDAVELANMARSALISKGKKSRKGPVTVKADKPHTCYYCTDKRASHYHATPSGTIIPLCDACKARAYATA